MLVNRVIINIPNKTSKTLLLSGVTIMLSLTIFASLVGEMLPVSDGSPLIG